MRVLVIKHGETIENRKGMTTGQKPGTLTKKGRAHAKSLGLRLRREAIDIIYSSDLKRCRDTVAIIRKSCHAPVVFDERLREISSGVLDGKSQHMLREAMRDSTASRFRWKPKGGESLAEFRKRVRAFVRWLRKQRAPRRSTVLLCTHSAWQSELLLALRLAATRTSLLIIHL